MSKVRYLKDSVTSIPSGAIIALGGNTLNRSPLSYTREIIRQNKTGLRIIKTAGALDVDMLCLANLVTSVDAGFISFETKYGLANNYRKSVQEGIVKANEHACYTVISALRAAKANVPFMPVYGLKNSDLIKVNDYFKEINDPFTGEKITVVKKLEPDIAVIHVHKADAFGNAEIIGPNYDDVLIAKGSKKVIITTEQLVQANYFKNNPKKATISGVLVDEVIHIPLGAKPGAMPSKYSYDENKLKAYSLLKTKNELYDFIKQYDYIDSNKSRWQYE